MLERNYLVTAEVERLLAATKGSRNAARDRCLLLLMFRHGLRVSEACGLKRSQVDLENRVLHVSRLKKGLSTTQPLRPEELRAIKAWLAERKAMQPATDAFFVSERRGPLSRKTAWRAVRKYGERAGALAHLSAHAAPRLRLRPGRPGRGYPADPGLPRASQHPAHRPLHRRPPGAV